ncbi:MAG: 5-formyltetrahydrofolate cyclo-ligase, partial [Thermoplasmata archaeon]
MIYPVEIENLDDLERGAFGILEPQNKKIYTGDIDIIIVPGIAFDFRGYRIGYGKGFYDRFLRGADALKIGIAYDFQIVKQIPEDDGDVPVDIIVSEKRVLFCRKI